VNTLNRLTVGNVVGGRLGDRNLMGTVVGCFAGLIAVLLVLSFVSHLEIASLAVLVVWGALAFALVSPLQIWVLEAATDAPNLASTLNQGAFNLGNATGAWLGGAALTAGVDYARLPWIGAGVAVVALGLTLSAIIRPATATARGLRV
jgi:DHA1 family inner membrane transport protein